MEAPKAGPRGKKQKPRQYTSEEWEGQRENFTILYQDEGLKLADAIKSMAENYGFYAT